MGKGLGAVPAAAGDSGGQGEEIRDVLPPVALPEWTWERVAFLGGLGVVLVGILGWGFWVWRGRRAPLRPPPSPYAVAQEALRRLRGPEGQGLEPRDFAAEVAGVLRRFWEVSLGIRVTRQTSEEFLRSVESHARFDVTERERLRVFLDRCDQCKFAGYRAEEGMREGLLEAAEAQVKGGEV